MYNAVHKSNYENRNSFKAPLLAQRFILGFLRQPHLVAREESWLLSDDFPLQYDTECV